MHRTYFAGIGRSLRNPSLENITKLANALSATLSELFTGEFKPARAKSTRPRVKARPRRR
jgi:hypothetical protein